MTTQPFSTLGACDLVVEQVYAGGSSGNAGDDPIAPLLPGSGNQGGIRVSGRQGHRLMVVLYTTGKDVDWIDRLDCTNGRLTYFGENKDPNKDLHKTKGNQSLRDIFRLLMQGDRIRNPPYFLFYHHPMPESRQSIRFGGLAVPGWSGCAPTTTLDAVWEEKEGRYFHNYRACLTVLCDQVISRAWIQSIVAGTPDYTVDPAAWEAWRHTGTYHPLRQAANGEDA